MKHTQFHVYLHGSFWHSQHPNYIPSAFSSSDSLYAYSCAPLCWFSYQQFQLPAVSVIRSFSYTQFQLSAVSVVRSFSYPQFQLPAVSVTRSFSYPQFQLSAVHHDQKKSGKIEEIIDISFKTRAEQEQAVTWWNPAAQTYPVLGSPSFDPICFHTELASILLLAFSLFALVATLSQCLCSESPYLLITLYCIYVCYTNTMFYIAFGIIRGFM
jgi:hypothetical protein